MKKIFFYITLCIVTLTFTACQSDDLSSYAQHSDDYGYIRFGVQPERMVTRASTAKNNYNIKLYPETMGIFCDLLGIRNQKASLNSVDTTWSIQTKWDDVAYRPSYTYFAYMPYVESNEAGDNVTLTQEEYNIEKEEDKKTLMFQFNMPKNTSSVDSAVTFVQKNAPMICTKPVEVEMYGSIGQFYMSQTLTAYSFNFALGDKMDNVRDITITKVELRDTLQEIKTVPETDKDKSKFYKSGKCSRTYTRKEGEWTSEDVKWSSCEQAAFPQTIEVFNDPIVDGDSKTSTALTLTQSMQQWGDTLFAIPHKNFTPYIQVTYNVTLNDNGDTTRKTVVSTIQLNSTNFSNANGSYNPNGGTPAKIFPINIKIVPKYLYVLADGDQIAGQIEIPSN